MSNLSRRAVLAGTAAVAVAAAPIAASAALAGPAPGVPTDTHLEALWATRLKLIAFANRRGEAWEALTGYCPDWVNERLYARLHDLDAEIMSTPARSVAGIRVKLRLWFTYEFVEIDARLPSIEEAYQRREQDYTDWAAFSAWADSERLSGKPGVSVAAAPLPTVTAPAAISNDADAELRRLFAERTRTLSNCNTGDGSDEHIDYWSNRAALVEEKIVATPTASVEGALVKMRMLIDYDLATREGGKPKLAEAYSVSGKGLDRDMIVSLWADLHRLAGGAA